jgi:hypothetical protein
MDLGLRRSHLKFYASLKNKVFVYTELGYDGLTYRSEPNPTIKLYNAETEYFFIKDKLHVGFGLNSWNGVSRYNNSQFCELLTVDNPGFTLPVNGTFSREGRQIGVYIKGTLNKLNYRISVVKPFEAGIDSITEAGTFERINENFAFKGYFFWQFFDKENSLFPELTMNNLGRSKLLNVGAGFYYHPEAMLIQDEKDLSTIDPYIVEWLISQGQIDLLPNFVEFPPYKISDVFLAAVDVFLDMPLKNKGAVTSYLGYNYYFLGTNYLHSTGTMNVSKMAVNIALPQGVGNSEWGIGTGHIIRGELGYLFPGEILKSKIQPYAAFTWKNFEALDQTSLQFDAGVNWLTNAHHLKWTLQYSNRPVYHKANSKNVISSYKGQCILQTQIYF